MSLQGGPVAEAMNLASALNGPDKEVLPTMTTSNSGRVPGAAAILCTDSVLMSAFCDAGLRYWCRARGCACSPWETQRPSKAFREASRRWTRLRQTRRVIARDAGNCWAMRRASRPTTLHDLVHSRVRLTCPPLPLRCRSQSGHGLAIGWHRRAPTGAMHP